MIAECLQQVRSMADGPLSLVKHVKYKADFTQQTLLINTGRGCVLES